MGKLQEALKEVQNTHIKEVDEMNAQLERQRQKTEELTEAVSGDCLITFWGNILSLSPDSISYLELVYYQNH